MFERFRSSARTTVVLAQAAARRRGDPEIDSGHLLLGILADRGPAGATVREAGVTADAVEAALERAARRGGLGDADVRSLAAMGIDADEVRRQMEAALGEGALRRRGGRRRRPLRTSHMPFSAAARAALERSLREARDLRHRHIGAEHVLLALLGDPHTVPGDVLADVGADPDRLCSALFARLRAS